MDNFVHHAMGKFEAHSKGEGVLMNDPAVFKNPCAICRKREAERLCDFVIVFNRYPIYFKDYRMFKDSVENGQDETCDLPLCKECRIEVGGADLCPYHYDLYERVELPEKLRKYQRESKARLRKEAEFNKNL
ncbi:hypothetical protein [Bacillus subtilis]|uniref:hypothetical protein n=2 Tax=Bacillus TaxID=1386 RepID=UPI000828D8C8|nr:hypothetical protein [Bacillus subtilis]OCB94458.1 hypothetical protein SRCM101294_02668 [Bacillus amyloliquefaciens]